VPSNEISRLKRFAGMPVPATVRWVNGKPDFRQIDEAQYIRAYRHGLPVLTMSVPVTATLPVRLPRPAACLLAQPGPRSCPGPGWSPCRRLSSTPGRRRGYNIFRPPPSLTQTPEAQLWRRIGAVAKMPDSANNHVQMRGAVNGRRSEYASSQ
jgi:hypothetical protein